MKKQILLPMVCIVLVGSVFAQQVVNKHNSKVKMDDTVMVGNNGHPKPVVVTEKNKGQFQNAKPTKHIGALKPGDTVMIADPRTGRAMIHIVDKNGKY